MCETCGNPVLSVHFSKNPRVATEPQRKRRLPTTLFSVAALLVVPVSPAGAVPVPYKNCGKPGDIVQVQAMDASVWPPPTAAPLVGTATIDPATGQLINLHVVLLFGVVWVFDSGSLATSAVAGFVPLPGSFPVSVTGPHLPVLAGPYNATHTFTSEGGGGASVTVSTKATVGQDIDAPLSSLSLTFNGTSGFPLPPAPGNYTATVQMTLPSGAEVFCVDLALTDVAFVNAAPAAGIPMLTRPRLLALLALVGGAGLLALRRRTTRFPVPPAGAQRDRVTR